MELFAIEPHDPSATANNLTEEIFTQPPIKEEISLSDWLARYTSFNFIINRYNIMSVTAYLEPRLPKREFPLPWQGGIEGPLFDKYRKQWRKDHGFDR